MQSQQRLYEAQHSTLLTGRIWKKERGKPLSSRAPDTPYLNVNKETLNQIRPNLKEQKNGVDSKEEAPESSDNRIQSMEEEEKQYMMLPTSGPQFHHHVIREHDYFLELAWAH